MNEFHKINEITFDQHYMYLHVDDQFYKLKLLDISPKLDQASDEIRKNFKISPSGYGIHWAQIDEDLSIDGLIRQVRN
jgi:Protein of unknown function (DUF2442)